MPPEVWTEAFRVAREELGPQGRLAAPALCARLQDAAERHAAALGVSIEALRARQLTWVLARLRLRLEELPVAGEEVALRTWPSATRGFTVHRDFELEDGRGVAARATSIWFVLALERRRPVRVPDFVRALPRPDRPPALEQRIASLPRLREADHQKRFALQPSDLDGNEHVNHVRYVEWAFDTLPAEFRATHRPHELELDFRAEIAGTGEVISRIERRSAPQGALVLGSLARNGAGEDAVRWRSLWRARPAP